MVELARSISKSVYSFLYSLGSTFRGISSLISSSPLPFISTLFPIFFFFRALRAQVLGFRKGHFQLFSCKSRRAFSFLATISTKSRFLGGPHPLKAYNLSHLIHGDHFNPWPLHPPPYEHQYLRPHAHHG